MALFALIDPHWGEPKVVPGTIRDTEEAAWEAGVRTQEAALYSGASEFPLPHGTPGRKSRLIEHGFRVKRITITIED